MVSEKCLKKGMGFINKLNLAREITSLVHGGHDILIIDLLERKKEELGTYEEDIKDIAKTVEIEFEEQGWDDKSYNMAKKLEQKIIEEAFDAVVECEKGK